MVLVVLVYNQTLFRAVYEQGPPLTILYPYLRHLSGECSSISYSFYHGEKGVYLPELSSMHIFWLKNLEDTHLMLVTVKLAYR